jgi:ribonuclease HII
MKIEFPVLGTKSKMLKCRFRADNLLEAGVDEAGRGCLWGRIYAGAVLWPPEEEWTEEYRELAPQIKDSKKIAPKKRALIGQQIQALAIDCGTGFVEAAEIDEHGMTYANRVAFERAIASLSVNPDRILVDGTLPLTLDQMGTLGIQEQEVIVDGDANYLPIAAASILAKEAHDDWLKGEIVKRPELETKWSLGSCKGYGTEKHRNAIVEHGMDSEHRRLFLRKLFGNTCIIDDGEA